MNVIRQIRANRFFRLAFKQLLSPQVRKELKKESQFREIDIGKIEQGVSEVQDIQPKPTKAKDLNNFIEMMERTPINESDVIIEQLEQSHQQKEQAVIVGKQR